MAVPKRQRGKVQTDGVARTHHDLLVHAAREKPGIGDYDISRGTLDTRGGKFNESHPKSEIEWMIYRHSEYPGTMVVLPSTLDTRGGRFNKSAKPLTERDWIEKRARKLPAPGDYIVDAGSLSAAGGRFSESRPKSDLEWKIHHALKHPSSHIVLPSTLETKGQRFNRSLKPLTELDFLLKRAKELPGPGEYPHHKEHTVAHASVSGGKFNLSKPKNDVEWKIVSARCAAWCTRVPRVAACVSSRPGSCSIPAFAATVQLSAHTRPRRVRSAQGHGGVLGAQKRRRWRQVHDGLSAYGPRPRPPR